MCASSACLLLPLSWGRAEGSDGRGSTANRAVFKKSLVKNCHLVAAPPPHPPSLSRQAVPSPLPFNSIAVSQGCSHAWESHLFQEHTPTLRSSAAGDASLWRPSMRGAVELTLCWAVWVPPERIQEKPRNAFAALLSWDLSSRGAKPLQFLPPDQLRGQSLTRTSLSHSTSCSHCGKAGSELTPLLLLLPGFVSLTCRHIHELFACSMKS